MERFVDAAMIAGFVAIFCVLVYQLWYLPVYCSLGRVKERAAERVATLLRDNCLSRPFSISHVDQKGDVRFVRFLKPYGCQLLNAPPEKLENVPRDNLGFLRHWSMSERCWLYARVCRFVIELDGSRLPLNTSLEDILTRREAIITHASCVFGSFGARGADIQWFRYGPGHDRLLFHVVFNGKVKQPAIQTAAMRNSIAEDIEAAKLLGDTPAHPLEEFAQRNLLLEIIRDALTKHGGALVSRDLWKEHEGQISLGSLRRIFQSWEEEGLCTTYGGRSPRRLIPSKINELVARLEAHVETHNTCAPLRMIDQDFEPDDSFEPDEDLESEELEL